MIAVGLRWAEPAAAKSSPTDSARMLEIGYTAKDKSSPLHTKTSAGNQFNVKCVIIIVMMINISVNMTIIDDYLCVG